MDDIYARAPIDRLAARVVMFSGEHYIPNKKILTKDNEMPLSISNLEKEKQSPKFEDIRGKKFGRFTVIGLSSEIKGRWVVRCDCGTYSLRKKKAIFNPLNTQDRCENCRHLAYLKRSEYTRRTGHDIDINEF